MTTEKDPHAPAQYSGEDPLELARHSELDDLQRMIAAEDLLEKRYQRRKRSARVFNIAQALVGYVALAGFFANAYQNWNNKKQAEERSQKDEERWGKEFKRSQDADKYRAFFETSALATDRENPDKRLVGYALLKEFVDDKDYNAKATFMLEESLALELRDDKVAGLDEPHRAAVVAILTALSHTSDCRALGRAARTIDKLAIRHSQRQDTEESQEVLGLYVLRVVGRATQVCTDKEMLDARKPIRDFILHQPAIAGLSGKVTPFAVDHRIADILRERCTEEAAGGASESADVPAALDKICVALLRDKLTDGAGLCAPPTAIAPAMPPPVTGDGAAPAAPTSVVPVAPLPAVAPVPAGPEAVPSTTGAPVGHRKPGLRTEKPAAY